MRHVKYSYSAVAPSEGTGLVSGAVHTVAIPPSSYDGRDGAAAATAAAAAAGIHFRRKPSLHVILGVATICLLTLGLTIGGASLLLAPNEEPPLVQVCTKPRFSRFSIWISVDLSAV